VERPKLGVLSKHVVQCKGHSKVCRMPLWSGVIQVFVHDHHELNLYHEDVFQIWTIHGRNMRCSSLVAKLDERACTLLCVPFCQKGWEIGVGWYFGEQETPIVHYNIVSIFVEDRWLYRNEVYSEALIKKLEPIMSSNMVCLSIFRGGIVTYVCLVCLYVWFYGFTIFLCVNFQFVNVTYY
jgi:hypothetical protein